MQRAHVATCIAIYEARCGVLTRERCGQNDRVSFLGSLLKKALINESFFLFCPFSFNQSRQFGKGNLSALACAHSRRSTSEFLIRQLCISFSRSLSLSLSLLLADLLRAFDQQRSSPPSAPPSFSCCGTKSGSSKFHCSVCMKRTSR